MVLQRRRADDEVTRLHIRHDDTVADPPGNTAGCLRIPTIQLENLAERRVESPPGKQPKCILALIENLHAGHIGAHDGNGGVEDPLVKRLDILFPNQFGADFLEPLRRGEFQGQPLLALTQMRLITALPVRG
jgi:hypothetical protein